jgi:hypothetical protein
MAKKAKAKKKKPLTGRGLRSSAQRRHRGKKLGTSARRQRLARVTARAARRTPAKAKRPVQKIRYGRTKAGRVRWQPIEAAKDSWSVSYASRQGARRAARRALKPARVVAVVAA